MAFDTTNGLQLQCVLNLEWEFCQNHQ